MLALALAFAPSVAQADVTTNTWTGTGTDKSWGTVANWDPQTTPSLNSSIGALFDLSEGDEVSLGYNDRTAYEVVIGADAGAFSFTAPSARMLSLRCNAPSSDASLTSFANLSGNVVTFGENITLTFASGYGSGNAGVFSGGSIIKGTLTVPSDRVFHLLGYGATGRDEALRTTTIDGKATVGNSFYVQTNHILKVNGSMEVAGNFHLRGSLVVANGATFKSPVLSAAYSAASATLEDGATACTEKLGVSSTDYWAMRGTVAVKGSVTLDTTGYSTTTIGTLLTFTDDAKLLLTGGGAVSFEENSPAIGHVAIAGNVTLATWPVTTDGEKLTIAPASIAYGETVTILTVKNATAADLQDSFSLVLDALPVIADSTKLTVEQSGEDVVVKIAYPAAALVTQKTNNQSWAIANTWNPEGEASAGNNYLVQGSYRLNTPNTETSEFPGDSLTIIGTSAASQAYVAQKSRYNTINKLYLGAYGTYHFQSYDSGASGGQWLKGNIHITADTSGSPAYFKATHAYACTLDAALSGDGELRFVPWDNYDFNLTITGDNSGYVGKMIFDRASSQKDVVTISTANALGGNPASELEDGVRLNKTTLKVTDDVAFTAANRIWTIYRASAIDVAEDKTVTIPAPFTYVKDRNDAPSLTKTGAGTLVLGGAVKKATDATFTVSTGTLEVTNENALKGIGTVTFATGTTLKVPLAGNGDNGFIIDGTLTATSLTVDFDKTGYSGEPPKKLALFSVKGTTATITAPTVTLTRYPKYIVNLVAEDVMIDGVAYVRYSAEFKGAGLVIILR